MVPDAWTFADQLHVYRLSMAPVRTEVTATILELLQVLDGVSAAGGCHGPHAKRQRHLNTDTYIFVDICYQEKMDVTELIQKSKS